MLCNGDQTQICGGPDRLTAFKYVTDPNEPTSTPTPTGPTGPTATPTATGLPEGFAYKGCWVDGPGFRIMGNQQTDDPDMTISSCSQACAALGYTVAGMEYSTQCFCDDVLRMDAKQASDDSQCGMSCGGNADEKCGGPDRLSVWSSQDIIRVVSPPKPKEKVDGYEYQGCITDPIDNRVFPWQLVNKTGNTPEWCLGQCKKFGYMAAGMEFGEEW
jgi:hypothetical protein